MVNCEVCGKATEEIYRAEIEGTQMDACAKCARFGKVLYTPAKISLSSKESLKGKKAEKEEPEQKIVDNYAKIVRKIREKLGLTQEEFAKKINEKESLMKGIESGKTIPSFDLAGKLEKMFNVVLIETVEEEKADTGSSGSKDFTLGDMITIKSRKK
ncbi:MAG: multiprotein bridging factor aMBF1 [Candidatus Nanoarchaeia archaeon]|nr:multiprotein bridging factor aMBF1 [Candidatus Nanoarchaeia archaeon]MDD5239631.1 multiprotein bridging factor aMBF1 [Candidatus Nanoarchaeia archaeon]